MASTSVDALEQRAHLVHLFEDSNLCDSRKGARASKRNRWVCRAEAIARPQRVTVIVKDMQLASESADLSANSAERILQASSDQGRRSDVAINSHGLFSAAETPPVERRFYSGPE